MTERLYYHDSLLLSFDARVVRIIPGKHGDKVVLDRTAFYPTSGGQPHDLGTLGTARVIGVEDNDEGEVVHALDRNLECGDLSPLSTREEKAATSRSTPNSHVHGEIDRARRIDHMQQHTGQHVLSAVFIELFQFPTVSFHMGEDLATIDLSIPKLTEEQVMRAEERANAVVFENRPVQVHFRDKEAVAAMGLRKETKREGEIRLVEIADLDICACGGTHVRATGEIGPILLRRFEKVKQGMRVEFSCGHRAVRWARRDYNALTRAAGLYSAGAHDLPELVAKKIEESRAIDKDRKRLLETLATYEAVSLYAQAAPNAAGVRVIEKTLDGDPDYARFLAAQIAKQPTARAILAVRQPPTLVLAQSAALGPDLGALMKQLGLRGGGSKDSAQAGAPDWATLERALVAAKEIA